MAGARPARAAAASSCSREALSQARSTRRGVRERAARGARATAAQARRRSSAALPPARASAAAVRGARRATTRRRRALRARWPRTRTTASFAGQQETYLHVRGAGRVAARVRDCWASFFSERALFYRARKGSLDDLRMAVVVQRMVEPDVAGILFTIDPVQRRRDQMVRGGRLRPRRARRVGRRDARPLRDRARRAAQALAHRRAALRRGRCPAAAPRSAPLDARARAAARRSTRTTCAALAELGRTLEEHARRARRTSSGRSPAASCTCCSRGR